MAIMAAMVPQPLLQIGLSFAGGRILVGGHWELGTCSAPTKPNMGLREMFPVKAQVGRNHHRPQQDRPPKNLQLLRNRGFLYPLMGLAAFVLLAVCLSPAQGDPVPSNITAVPQGISQYAGHLNETESAWFRLAGNSSMVWNFSATSVGAAGNVGWFFTAENETTIWRSSSHKVGYSTVPHFEYEQVFYNGTPYYVQFSIDSYASNASDGLNYSLFIGIQEAPQLSPGAPQYGTISYGLLSSYPELEYSTPYYRIDANESQEIEVNATLLGAPIAASGGPSIGVLVYSYERPYAGYDQFPIGWRRFGETDPIRSEFWAYQRLNLSICTSLGCTASARFVAPYDGSFFVNVQPYSFPILAQVRVEYDTVIPAFAAENTSMANAQALGHRPYVDGRLLNGLDPYDWFMINLNTSFGPTLTLWISDSATFGDGNLKCLSLIHI